MTMPGSPNATPECLAPGQFAFQLIQQDSKTRARRGLLRTPHGVVETPVFMSVGTQASVKAIDPRELDEMGTQIILGNTYHLNIRPGMEIIRAAGGGLFLIGSLIMAYNLWMTVRAGEAEVQSPVALQPAE